MSIFDNFIIRSQFKSRLIPWIKHIKNRKNESVINQEPVVSDGVDKDEFRRRYKNLLISMSVVGVFFAGSFAFMLSHVVSGGFMNGLNFMLVSLITGLYLLKLSYLSWLSRLVFSNWDNRNEPNQLTMLDYLAALKINPMIMFRLSLSDKM